MNKLAICIPWDTPFVWTAPMFSIMNLERPDGVEVKYFRGHGWCPAMRHNKAVLAAMNWGADYIQFLGADQMFKEDTLIRLAQHVPQWDMVTGIVPSRGQAGPEKEPFKGIAYQLKSNAGLPEDPIMNFSSGCWNMVTEKDIPQEIHCIGTGILLMKAEIFGSVAVPWFVERLAGDHSYSRIPVMDTGFVLRCTLEYGARLWLDTSIHSEHLDIFPIDWTYQDRFEDMAGDSWTPMRKYLHNPKVVKWGE